MLKFGDRVTAPRSWVEGSPRVTGVITDTDEEDERGWWYRVHCPDGSSTWTHADETVLAPDHEREAQDERIAQLTLELANNQVKLKAADVKSEEERRVVAGMYLKWEQAEEALGKAQATIATLKALVCDVSDASAAKEAIWFATETYNQKAEKARATLAAIEAQDGKLSWYSSRSGE